MTKIERDRDWWMGKAADETETVGATSTPPKKSLKTLSDIELTDEDKALLHRLLSRPTLEED